MRRRSAGDGAALKIRKRRKKSALTYATRILRATWRHPNNRGRRARAVVRAVGWQLYKRLLRRPVDVRVFERSVLRAYPDSTSASNCVYFGAYFDFAEMAFMRRYLRPGDAFLDAGANIGAYTLLAAELVGAAGSVIAVEPHPLVVRRLRENVALNDYTQVTVVEAALAATEGAASFLLEWDVSNRLAGPDDAGQAAAEVRTTRLDALIPPGRRLAMAKLDLEGAEIEALGGATRTLAATPPAVIQAEVLDGQLRRRETSASELTRILSEAGYEPRTYDPDRRALQPAPRPVHGNVLFVHHRHGGRVAERLAAPPAASASR